MAHLLSASEAAVAGVPGAVAAIASAVGADTADSRGPLPPPRHSAASHPPPRHSWVQLWPSLAPFEAQKGECLRGLAPRLQHARIHLMTSGRSKGGGESVNGVACA